MLTCDLAQCDHLAVMIGATGCYPGGTSCDFHDDGLKFLNSKGITAIAVRVHAGQQQDAS